jgi:hypothetical protein
VGDLQAEPFLRRSAELYCLEGFATTAAARDRQGTAAELLGRAKIVRKGLGIVLQQYEQRLHDATVSAATDAVGADEFARLFEAGPGTDSRRGLRATAA